MKRERLYRVSVDELDGVTIEYFLTVDDVCRSDPYGIGIVMRKNSEQTEEYVNMEHICSDRQEMVRFIERLAQGKVCPVSLAEIMDDYLA